MPPFRDAYPEMFLAIAQDHIRAAEHAERTRLARRRWWRVVQRGAASR
ncbi:hypothetical protein [Nocardioides sp. zg-1228]|nr:hypothetical protein [Nocardioides sp. zg-1228]MBC2933031.1 hypothetical protein [Nocardioides sp. zg-1228]QSF56775.1 hypothetical protein JX575_14360 [Nocardioides sp. zg-1228]